MKLLLFWRCYTDNGDLVALEKLRWRCNVSNVTDNYCGNKTR